MTGKNENIFNIDRIDTHTEERSAINIIHDRENNDIRFYTNYTQNTEQKTKQPETKLVNSININNILKEQSSQIKNESPINNSYIYDPKVDSVINAIEMMKSLITQNIMQNTMNGYLTQLLASNKSNNQGYFPFFNNSNYNQNNDLERNNYSYSNNYSINSNSLYQR